MITACQILTKVLVSVERELSRYTMQAPWRTKAIQVWQTPWARAVQLWILFPLQTLHRISYTQYTQVCTLVHAWISSCVWPQPLSLLWTVAGLDQTRLVARHSLPTWKRCPLDWHYLSSWDIPKWAVDSKRHVLEFLLVFDHSHSHCFGQLQDLTKQDWQQDMHCQLGKDAH